MGQKLGRRRGGGEGTNAVVRNRETASEIELGSRRAPKIEFLPEFYNEKLRLEEFAQAQPESLIRGGRIFRTLGLGGCFEKKVEQPRKGDTIKQIRLKVPFTTEFVKEQRRVDRVERKDNFIRTSKYNIFTFVPLASMYQFRRFTNAFYLGICIIALVGWYGDVNGQSLWIVSYNPVTIIILLAVVVGVALIFEGKDDINRHLADAKTNGQKFFRIRNRTLEETTSGELLPGDFVFVHDRQSCPADLVLLSAFGADKKGSMCYIETSSIDGETNLKLKEVPQFILDKVSEKEEATTMFGQFRNQLIRRNSSMAGSKNDSIKVGLANFIPQIASGLYEYEQPNSFLQFQGTFTPFHNPKNEKFPLEFKNLILRGSQVRNTKWIIGMVAYAGHETKLALSRSKVPAKFSRIDRFVNKILACVFVLFLAMIIVADIILLNGTPDTDQWWYFQYTSSVNVFAVPGGVAYFFTYAVLFANIIPIPCVVIIEVLNFYAQYVLENDIELYHPESDTRAECRTGNLVTDIGQITHIFSDKTGTLTRNEMKMVGCFVNGEMYGYIPPEVEKDEDDEEEREEKEEEQMVLGNSEQEKEAAEEQYHGSSSSKSSSSAKSINLQEVFADVIEMFGNPKITSMEKEKLFDFFLMLAFCHTVVLDFDENGDKVLNAESPDEEAFVKAAQVVGLELVSTGDGTIRISTPTGGEMEYRILALNPFNSTRKRMSMIFSRVHDGSIVLFMKGADNKMLERLAPGQQDTKKLMDALVRYSWHGLRTLVFGSKELDKEEYLAWEQKYKEAMVAPTKDRADALTSVGELIETNIHLVGASAIQDQLQLGVPESIKTLREAGIQVWVLTGDKIETAINIGLSSNLLDPKMLQLKLVSENVVELEQDLDIIISVLEHAMEPSSSSSSSSPREPRQEFDDNDATQNPRYSVGKLAPLEEGIKQAQSETNKKLGWADRWFDWWYKLVFRRHLNQDIQANVALIVSGASLEVLLAKQKGNPVLETKLLKIARVCKVVLACRVSPAQKSLIVGMVKDAPDIGIRTRPPVTLAIGDGANDVPMIQKAHVGVGISGHEGRQAVNSSDFSIAQFRFLVRMLLVHGRWNYRRQANVIVYVTYSWLLYVFLLFIYLPYSMFSGQQIYYETIYTALFAYFANVPICASGFFDMDISAASALRNPWTYGVGVKSDDLNYKKLFTLTLRAVTHLILIWALVFNVVPVTIPIDVLGAFMFLAIVMLLFVQQLLRGTTFNSMYVLIYVVMVIAFLLFMSATSSPPIIFDDANAGTVWTGVVLTVCSVIAIEMIVRYVKKEFIPRPLDLLIELDRGYYKGSKHAKSSTNDAIKVLEEFGKLTILPITFGAKSIKTAIEKRPSGSHHEPTSQEHQEGEQPLSVAIPGITRTSLLGELRSPFSRLKPVFDYSALGMRRTVSESMRMFASRRPQMHAAREQAEQDDLLATMSASRVELSQYQQQEEEEKTNM